MMYLFLTIAVLIVIALVGMVVKVSKELEKEQNRSMELLHKNIFLKLKVNELEKKTYGLRNASVGE
jgi:hypothetical protein